MGFLHKLWDETLAGPAPDSGLGKLRKYNSFSAARSSTPDDDDVPISRSITILRTNSNSAAFRKLDSGSLPSSPAASTTPTSPFSPGTPRGPFKRLTRRESTPDYPSERADPRNPTVYDWIVINALDR
ncbi:dormancy-associated protein homolog 4 [Camellia sinensis]|uniref:Uncharacterized protein n=1 Tax=Camellia sinensis var. sinensis TaxID=542762 RepID=A0A4S4ESI5_CAMSN|nr:dormancy-associated protein homolog 4 [Camellia sinensis]THG19789.1 hypothetical protein TEA_029739 [Camellia sinensis var. sinensis]